MKDDGLGCVVEIVDALFRDIAEIVVVGDDVSLTRRSTESGSCTNMDFCGW